VGARKQQSLNIAASIIDVVLAAAILFGVVAATICNFATQIAVRLGIDDALEVRNSSFPFLKFELIVAQLTDICHSWCRWHYWEPTDRRFRSSQRCSI
jgi:hypothetical protein